MSGVHEAVDRLRHKRGGQRVSFDDVADHLVDVVDRHPDSAAAVAGLADFLTAVEDVAHDHDADEDRGLPRA